jgi:5-methyltetrahydropteroyltriglutamate--homocysteine methyltransferase
VEGALVEGFPGGTFGIHLCKGNARTVDPATGKVRPQLHREGHYDAIAERVFSELKHDRFLLEYDDERSGGFEPLPHIRKGAVAVVGLATTKSPDVQDGEFLKRRIVMPRNTFHWTSSR